ncbi:Uncharacterized protein YydD, contains DUF2326 domain [Tangfeifania diversioriginum]|uniref:Uncharacterized protein YydD, contains DUF2326 domain n=2 Tax=Tangfeifania diversioriginum TaxID=1168035 RepID=A0A1M6DI88_9BACT|nr:Uncharacterized protein YydD, contains DUF2326 domain [Tangfeifania diversioriginum]
MDHHFNVVLARISDMESKDDAHNLGKTSLVHVINFLLLGKFNKNFFENELFNGQIFYGEIELNSGKFLILRRQVDFPTKISFKLNENKQNDFNVPESWDYEDIGFEKAQKTMDAYLGFDVLKNYSYRKSITYFLRTQQDYLDVYKLNKFQGKHITWKPFVFELLGFDGSLITKKLELEELAEEQKKKIVILKQEANVDIGEKDKLLGLIDIKEQEKNKTEATIDKFDFFEKDSSINQEIIDDLDFQIQTFNTERYRIGYEITKIEESLSESNNDINIEKLRILYQEVELYFPENIEKQFDDLIKFNKSITTERNKFLKENLSLLKDEYKEIARQIKILELDKSEKLSYLTERDSYYKFKGYQKSLAKLEAEIERLQDKVKAIDKSVKIEQQIKNINNNIENAIDNINDAIAQRNHANINRTFNSIIYDILDTNALISITQNKQGNVEFDANYQNPEDLLSTSEAQGTTYKKILCMAFDIALLIHYSDKSFFRFVYHDGILEGLDDRVKVRLLNKVKSICEEYDIQYILSLIDSDIPVLSDGSKYQFDDKEICLELNDKDDSGRLFLHSF